MLQQSNDGMMSCMETERVDDHQPKRQSVTLSARDLADLAMIRTSPEAQRAVGATAGMSEAALLHALLAHSLRQAREAAEEAGYAAYAEWARTDPEEVAVRASLRGRRQGREQRGSSGT